MNAREAIMQPVWIIDDDRSIRWVFEKALSREGIEYRTFSAAQEVVSLFTPALEIS